MPSPDEDALREECRRRVDQANHPEALEEARQQLARLFDAGDYEITDQAQLDGFPILRREGLRPTEGALVGWILDLLASNFPMHAVGLGEPPCSGGIGWVMNNADNQGLYIKLALEERRIGQGVAWLLSFHTSRHHRD